MPPRTVTSFTEMGVLEERQGGAGGEPEFSGAHWM